jgi:hypothetical protein
VLILPTRGHVGTIRRSLDVRSGALAGQKRPPIPAVGAFFCSGFIGGWPGLGACERVDIEAPNWLGHPFAAEILALPKSQPFTDIGDGRVLAQAIVDTIRVKAGAIIPH